jgi:hypothetical protein
MDITGAHSVPNIYSNNVNVHVVCRVFSMLGNSIYYQRSTNNGANWGDITSLTGEWTARQPFVGTSNDRVLAVWQDERDSNKEIYFERDPTGNALPDNGKGGPSSPSVALSIGESNADAGKEHERGQLRVYPNPFVAFATALGHEGERFVLYNIEGKLAGTFQGGRIGADLPPGIYFIKQTHTGSRLTRIVKTR